MKNLDVIKTQRYIKAFTTYGIIPLLTILDEYEKQGNFEECIIIRDAIQERIDRVNSMGHLGDDFDVPRRLEEVNTGQELYEFSTEDNFQRNLKFYVEKIKDIVANG